MADRGFSPDYSESTEIGRIMVSGAITEPNQLITKKYFEDNLTSTPVPVFLYQGKDTAAHILAKPATQNHLWISTTAGVDSGGAAVAIGDGMIADGSTWTGIGSTHGVTDHPSLSDRGAADAHPYTAITDVHRVFTDRIVGPLTSGAVNIAPDIDLIRKTSIYYTKDITPGTFPIGLFAKSGFITTYMLSAATGMQIMRSWWGQRDTGKMWTREIDGSHGVNAWKSHNVSGGTAAPPGAEDGELYIQYD